MACWSNPLRLDTLMVQYSEEEGNKHGDDGYISDKSKGWRGQDDDER